MEEPKFKFGDRVTIDGNKATVVNSGEVPTGQTAFDYRVHFDQRGISSWHAEKDLIGIDKPCEHRNLTHEVEMDSGDNCPKGCSWSSLDLTVSCSDCGARIYSVYENTHTGCKYGGSGGHSDSWPDGHPLDEEE